MWKRIWNDPVWSKVISAALIGLAALIGTYLLNGWRVIGSFFVDAFSLARASSSVPNWFLLLVGVLALPGVIAIGAWLWQTVRPPTPKAPSWQAYTSDLFFGLRWRWGYADGDLTPLTTFCPRCDCQVFPSDASAFVAIDRIAFHCDSCGTHLGAFDEAFGSLEDKARRFVQQKLRNGLWSKSAA